MKLIATVRRVHAQVRIKAIVADALYGTRAFLEQASAQTISQLRHNQTMRFRGREAGRGEAIVAMVRHLLSAADLVSAVAQWAEHVKAIYALAPSSKHMSGRDLGRQEPTLSLRYRALVAMVSD